MNLVLTSALIGLFLVYLEFFFPSGILGVLALLTLIGSIIVFIFQGYGWGWAILYAFSLFLAIGFVCNLALSRIKKKVSLKDDQEDFIAVSYDKKLIGKEGIVLSDLRPSGYISIDGNRLSAFSESGYIHKDSPVVVIGGRGDMLIVRKREES